MDLISILATVILTTTIGTVVVGVAAYGAFKLRDKRKPKKKTGAGGKGADEDAPPVFLTRFEFPVDAQVVGAVGPAQDAPGGDAPPLDGGGHHAARDQDAGSVVEVPPVAEAEPLAVAAPMKRVD